LNCDFIGNTTLRRCEYLSSKFQTNIFIKEEFHNPGMSSKDRSALFMIEDAIKQGKIKPGGTFVEASSGNTGLGIAMIAKHRGYKSKIFVSESCSEEKISLLRAAGAAIEICDNSNGLTDFYSTQFRAQAYAANHPNAYFTNQYYNAANIKAHYRTTGPEIWTQTDHQVTHFIAGVGTGGSISGVGRFLKERNENIQILGVEPEGSILSQFLETGMLPEASCPFDPIEGIGRTFVPGSFDALAVDRIMQVSSEDSITAALSYKNRTGFLSGFSSAALLASLEKYHKQMELNPQHVVVLLFMDHGSRYLSKLYDRKISSENIISKTI